MLFHTVITLYNYTIKSLKQHGFTHMAISRIEVFTRKIQLSEQFNIAKECGSELKYLRANYETSSMRRALTNYRNAIKKSDLNDDQKYTVLKHLVLSLEEKDALSKAEAMQVSNDMRNLRPVYEVDKYIDVAISLLAESSYLAQATGLCALTGRRAAEIGATGKFELIEGDTTHVLFSGQLKTKNRVDIAPYVIPVLGDAEKIVSTLNAIRAKKPNFINDPEKFHDAASKELNRRVKRFFPFVSDTPLAIKDLRSIYGELNFYFEDNRTIAKSKYISSILGHTEDDITTGQSYLDFYICDENYC